MPAHFGLDIGLYSIKLVEARKKGSSYQLAAFGEARTLAPLDSKSEQDKIAVSETIKKLVADSKTTTKNVALSLSENDVFSQVIELPYLSSAELASAIKFEAEQYIPVPLEEVKIDYLVLKMPPKEAITEKMEVLLVGAKKQALDNITKLVEKAGLYPLIVETEVLSIIRGLASEVLSTVFILDFGFRSTNLIIVKDGILKFIRTLSTGGEAFTRAIAKSFNMDIGQAEQYKVSYGVDEALLEGKVSKAIEPALSAIVEEVKRSLEFFSQKEAGMSPKNLILSGSGANMPGLSSFLTTQLNLEVTVADPFFKFEKDEKLKSIAGRPGFTTAVGLAVREDD